MSDSSHAYQTVEATYIYLPRIIKVAIQKSAILSTVSSMLETKYSHPPSPPPPPPPSHRRLSHTHGQGLTIPTPDSSVSHESPLPPIKATMAELSTIQTRCRFKAQRGDILPCGGPMWNPTSKAGNMFVLLACCTITAAVRCDHVQSCCRPSDILLTPPIDTGL